MTYYLGIDPVQEPFPLGVDDEGRAIVMFNVDATCEATLSFLEEIVTVLGDAGVGTAAVDIFAGLAAIPPGAGPYLSIAETGGAPPMHTHNERSPPAYVRPSAQITTRAATYTAARTMAYNAYLALLAVLNSDIGSVSPFPLVAIPVGQGAMRARLWGDPVDATPVELYRDGVSTRLTIEAGLTVGFVARVVARGSAGTIVADYVVEGAISNNAGTTVLVWWTKQTRFATAGYGISASADDTADALVFTVTGAAHWEADVQMVRAA